MHLMMTGRRAPWRQSIWLAVLAVLLVGATATLLSSDHGCVESTPDLDSMTWGQLWIDADGADPVELPVRLAVTPAQRAAGMQHLCPDAVAANPMLFVFSQPQFVGFHMNNVHADLDIAFIGPDWHVIEVARMVQGGGASSGARIRAALEVKAGDAERLGIAPGTTLRLPDGAAASTAPRAVVTATVD